MHQSADMEFLYACGHLLRGHGNAACGHIRTMAENAGIALLSVTEPDIADLYLEGKIDRFRRRTGGGRILPKDNPLTARLNSFFDYASKRTHANLIAMSERVTTKPQAEGSRGHLRQEVRFQDMDPARPPTFLRPPSLLVTASVDCLAVFHASFSLPQDSEWCEGLRSLEGARRDWNQKYCDVLDPEEES